MAIRSDDHDHDHGYALLSFTPPGRCVFVCLHAYPCSLAGSALWQDWPWFRSGTWATMPGQTWTTQGSNFTTKTAFYILMMSTHMRPNKSQNSLLHSISLHSVQCHQTISPHIRYDELQFSPMDPGCAPLTFDAEEEFVSVSLLMISHHNLRHFFGEKGLHEAFPNRAGALH